MGGRKLLFVSMAAGVQSFVFQKLNRQLLADFHIFDTHFIQRNAISISTALGVFAALFFV
jgi:hypothetical protein